MGDLSMDIFLEVSVLDVMTLEVCVGLPWLITECIILFVYSGFVVMSRCF